MKQNVIKRFAAMLRSLDEDGKVFPRGFLADEFGQNLRAQAGFGGVLIGALGGDFAVAQLASSCRQARMTWSTCAASPSRSITRATAAWASGRR